MSYQMRQLKQPGKFTIVFLDDVGNYRELLGNILAVCNKKGRDLEILFERPDTCYSPVPSVAESTVTRLCESTFPDLIVIGNNKGASQEFKRWEGKVAGLEKVETLPPGIRHKVVVVWEKYHSSKKKPYVALGCKHFCARSKLASCLAKILAEIEKGAPHLQQKVKKDIAA